MRRLFNTTRFQSACGIAVGLGQTGDLTEPAASYCSKRWHWRPVWGEMQEVEHCASILVLLTSSGLPACPSPAAGGGNGSMPLREAAVLPPSASEMAFAMDGGIKDGTYLPPGFFAALPPPDMLAVSLAAAAALAAAEAAGQTAAIRSSQ